MLNKIDVLDAKIVPNKGSYEISYIVYDRYLLFWTAKHTKNTCEIVRLVNIWYTVVHTCCVLVQSYIEYVPKMLKYCNKQSVFNSLVHLVQMLKKTQNTKKALVQIIIASVPSVPNVRKR